MIVGRVSWTNIGRGVFMAGSWRDSQDLLISAMVAGKRGDWHYTIRRFDGVNPGTETIALGQAETKILAMEDAMEIVRGYFRGCAPRGYFRRRCAPVALGQI